VQATGSLQQLAYHRPFPYADEAIGQNLRYPIMLGHGKRLFGDNALASAFTLAHATSTPSGVLITRCMRNGEVRTGAFEESA